MQKFLQENIKTKGVMMKPYNKNLKQVSRDLRNNMTDAEKLLWSRIRDYALEQLGLKVLRFDNGQAMSW
jgi:very-short-patch-repair endonuclease